MAQAPATPKRKRALTLLKARLGLPLQDATLAPSERAALALRAARRDERWAQPDHVQFLIPLVGPHAVGNWAQVTQLLTRTLASLVAQSNPNWRATICCQEPPPLPDDPRLRHLPFDDPAPGNDKWRKLGVLYDDLARTTTGAGLAMTFDADDLAAPTLVERLLATPHARLLTHGYVYDAGADRLALTEPQSLRQPGAKAFWKLCGSCAATPFDTNAPSSAAQFTHLREMSQHEHRMIPYLTRLAGHRLTPVPTPEVLYLLNHGENFGARRGRTGFKPRYVERFAIRDTQAENAARSLFGLPLS